MDVTRFLAAFSAAAGAVLLAGCPASRPAPAPPPAAVTNATDKASAVPVRADATGFPIRPPPAARPVEVHTPAAGPGPAPAAWREGVTEVLGRCKTLEDVRRELRVLAAERPGEIAELARVLLGDDPLAAREAARALGRAGTPDAFIALIGLSHAVAAGPLRRDVLDAIAGIANRQSAELLHEALRVGDDEQVERMSQIALAGMMDPDMLKGTVERYRAASSPDERGALLGVIQQVRNPDLVDTFIGLGNPEGDASCAGPLGRSVVDTLGAIGTARAVGNLLARIRQNADAGIESTVIEKALARTVNRDALPVLAAAAGNPSNPSEARAAAMEALGNYTSAEVGEIVRRGMGDADPPVREAARRALNRLQGLEN
ncbi:MAG: HEAT repeat domain-containing protein [Verrucomicrobia bacterium]|nr:HEAT repeat domain-containing protein [Verrucomicrobiota bacterium]